MEDEDWTDFATSDFGSTAVDLWSDVVPLEPSADEGEQPEQLETHMAEMPRAPSIEGIKHLVRIGTCTHCLGRLCGRSRFDRSSESVGSEVLAEMLESHPPLETPRGLVEMCPFCEDLMSEVDLLADRIRSGLEGREVQRLQVGARFPRDQLDQEDDLRSRFGAAGSAGLKPELVETIASKIIAEMDGTRLVKEKPEVLALIDVVTLAVELDVRSTYLYGRYTKEARDLPQTRWPCRSCKGRGCERCEGTGLRYAHSVQDLIGGPLIETMGGADHAFHGMGREDIDVRCLGRGRPFVIEIKEPERRTVDLASAMERINEHADGRIAITDLRPSTRSEVVRIKDTPAEKSYTVRFTLHPLTDQELATLRAPIVIPERPEQGGKRRGRRRRPQTPRAEAPPQPEDLTSLTVAALKERLKDAGLPVSGTKSALIERLQAGPEESTLPMPDPATIEDVLRRLEGTLLDQRTPVRVSHRRPDLIRKRRVMEIGTIEVHPGDPVAVEVTLRCESGTYVKETVHGDGGRTQPSFASCLEARCEVEWLDVADIHAD